MNVLTRQNLRDKLRNMLLKCMEYRGVAPQARATVEGHKPTKGENYG